MTDEKKIPILPDGYTWGKHGPKTLPEWMDKYRDIITDTGGNPIEWLISLGGEDTKNNIALAFLTVSVCAQIRLLSNLHDKGLLKED